MDDKAIKIENYKKLMEYMSLISSNMFEVIFKNYYDSDKYLFNLYYEGFKDVESFCLLMSNIAISQSAAILRMFIENVAMIDVLENHKEIKEKYIEFYKFRFSIRLLSSRKQKEKIVSNFPEANLKLDLALNYIDYGWLTFVEGNKDYGFKTLAKLANLSDVYEWVDSLNGFVHGTVTSSNVIGSGSDAAITYSHVLIDIAAKLFDILCCRFHNNTKFMFEFNDVSFQKFRDLYEKMPPVKVDKI